MNSDTPKRFRFSLRFLLAWVLLTSGLFGITFRLTNATPVKLSYFGSVTDEVLINSGWPFQTYWIETAGEQSAPEFEYKLLWFGVLGNLAVCAAVSLTICILVQLVRRFSAYSVVKNG